MRKPSVVHQTEHAENDGDDDHRPTPASSDEGVVGGPVQIVSVIPGCLEHVGSFETGLHDVGGDVATGTNASNCTIAVTRPSNQSLQPTMVNRPPPTDH